MRIRALFIVLLFVVFTLRAHACPALSNVTFSSPLLDWNIVDDAGFGDAALHGGHLGVDLVAPWGTPVLAAADGVVVRAVTASMKYKNEMCKPDVPVGQGRHFGTNVLLGHGGLYTLYGHLSKVLVKPGQHVHRGQVIALSGNTGNSTGPHLHFAIADNETLWGYAGDNFKADCYTFLNTTYYNPEALVSHVNHSAISRHMLRGVYQALGIGVGG